MTYLRDLREQRLAPLRDEIRAIVREEIVNALGALGREADSLDSYDTGELESAALNAIGKAADGTVQRLTCPHERYTHWGTGSLCTRCGEPEPAPENPFKDKEPDPDCNHAWLVLEDGSRVCQLCEGVRRTTEETTDGTS